MYHLQTRRDPARRHDRRATARGTAVVIKGFPRTFDNCGEYYLTADMSARVLALAEEAVRHGAEVEVLRFAA